MEEYEADDLDNIIEDDTGITDSLDSDSDNDNGRKFLSLFSESDSDAPTTDIHPISQEEQIYITHLRRHIDALADKVSRLEQEVAKTQEEKKKCGERIAQLTQEKNATFEELQKCEEHKQISAGRVQSRHQRICDELHCEKKLLETISKELEQCMLKLSQAQIEQGKMILKEDDLKKKEQEMESAKTFVAQTRVAKETNYKLNAQKTWHANEEKQRTLLELAKVKTRHIQEEAERSHAKHEAFLKQTVQRLKERRDAEQLREQAHIDKRINTMLSLKKDISQNRENLRALQARDRAALRQAEQETQARRDKIMKDGGNPDVELIKTEQVLQFERKKQKFIEEQRHRQTQIASAILDEEVRIEKRKQQKPHLYPDKERDKEKIVSSHKRKMPRQLKKAIALKDEELRRQSKELGEVLPSDSSSSDDDRPGGDAHAHPSARNEDDTDSELMEPEFKGLWDRHEPYQPPKDAAQARLENTTTTSKMTKMEKEILTNVLEAHRQGIVVKQVAGGREFSGCAFNSKPEVIHFKDFEVGKTYKKKVVLTNVSYSVNYCKLLDLSDHLKDFITLKFDPPGQLSAGLTFELMVTFQPMINEIGRAHV